MGVLLETPLHQICTQAMVIFYSLLRRHRSNSKASFSSSSAICAPQRRRCAPHMMHACRDQLERASWNQHRIEHSWAGGTSRQRCRQGARTSSNSLVSVCAAQVRRTEYLPHTHAAPRHAAHRHRRRRRHLLNPPAWHRRQPNPSQPRARHGNMSRRGEGSYGVGAGLRSMSTASTQNRYLPFGACPRTRPALVATPPPPIPRYRPRPRVLLIHAQEEGALTALEAGQKMFSTGVAVASRAWALRSTSRSARTQGQGHGHAHGHGARPSAPGQQQRPAR
eukprot:COSAG01_NODE_1179_length_11363_cov_18.944701_5_plen_279_part_00